MADADRIPHALMLLGMPGSGDLPMALAFAQYALCENRQEGDSCGVCRSCVKVEKLVHPDLHFAFPVVGAHITSDHHLDAWRKAMLENPYLDVNEWLQQIEAENKQGNINKDECNLIIRKLSLKIFEGRYKILCVWLPEFLGKEGNRLLKLIEEPPEQTLMIFVAHDQESILYTLLSRCQLVKVQRLSDEEVEAGLTSRMQIPAEKARSISQMVNGDLNEARKIALQPDNNLAGLFFDWLRKCYVGNGVELVQWIEKFAALGRENQKQFIQYGLHFLKEYKTLKLTGGQMGIPVRLLPKEMETARNLTQVIGFDQLGHIVRLFDECAYYIERNANQKLLFLDASIQMNRILRK